MAHNNNGEDIIHIIQIDIGFCNGIEIRERQTLCFFHLNGTFNMKNIHLSTVPMKTVSDSSLWVGLPTFLTNLCTILMHAMRKRRKSIPFLIYHQRIFGQIFIHPSFSAPWCTHQWSPPRHHFSPLVICLAPSRQKQLNKKKN